jgi:WD domain, G-beta repeat
VATRAILSYGGTLSGNGRFVGFDVSEPGKCGPSCFTSVVVDLETGKRVFKLEAPETQVHPHARRLNHDGTLLVYGDDPTEVYEIRGSATAGSPIARLSSPGGGNGSLEFDRTDGTVFETSANAVLRHWVPSTGEVLATWPHIGQGRPSIAADGRTVLVSDVTAAGAVLLDSAVRGDVGEVATCQGFVTAGSLAVRNGLAAFSETCGPQGFTQVIDLQKRERLRSMPGQFAQDLAVSPDGRSVVAQQFKPPNFSGPLIVSDLRTGAAGIALRGLCWYDGSAAALQPPCVAYPGTPFRLFAQRVEWSPDGTLIAAVNQYDWHIVVWDARDGHLVFKGPKYPDLDARQVIFTPDSKGLLVDYSPKVNHAGPGLVEMLSTETWTVVKKADLDPAVVPPADGMGFVGFSPDGSTIFAVGGLQGFHSSLLWLDAATLQVKDPKPIPIAQSVRAVALSPDGSSMATAGGDAVLRVWDTKTGEVTQEIDFGGLQLQGVGYIDRTHLAVSPQGGGLLIMTIDASELVKLVRASLTRSFTDTECKTYGIDPCPTLEQLRTGN